MIPDRIIGTKWILLFLSITNPDEFKERDHFLKLFITSLGSKCLVGPFKNPPDATEPFKAKLKPADIRKLILKLKSKNYPYFIEFSKNLFEYSVCQEQDFGAQIFYGFSIEPIPIWSSGEKAILKTKDLEGAGGVPLTNLSFFETKERLEEIDKILTSTRINPKTKSSPEISPPIDQSIHSKKVFVFFFHLVWFFFEILIMNFFSNPKIPVRFLKRQQAIAVSKEGEQYVRPEKKHDSKSEKIDETVHSEIA